MMGMESNGMLLSALHKEEPNLHHFVQTFLQRPKVKHGIKGGVVMRSISGNARHATQDLDLVQI